MTALSSITRFHRDTLRSFVRSAREPRRRTLAEFAEQEIVVTKGPAPGRFRLDRQPFARVLFEEIESGRWTEINIVGCVQSGKTLIGFVIIILFHLFEIKEAIICGVPKEDIAYSKWLQDIRPVIVGSRYAADMPLSGAGSKDGARTMSIYFSNGASLRFMSGGGSDAARASETARVVAITETSRMDKRSGTSMESNQIVQLKARTKAFDDAARVYMESTPTIEDGLAWQNHLEGSQGRIALQCPHCKEWNLPTDTPADREFLTGWKEAKDVIEAEQLGCFACLLCRKPWTEDERRAANLAAMLVHRGQHIERMPYAGEEPIVPINGTDFAIVGAMPRTKMLGFRWSAVNNMLRTAGTMAAEEWAASRAVDEDDSMRAIFQNLWALPYKPEMSEIGSLVATTLQERTNRLPRGMLPDDTVALTIGIDLGKFWAYFVVLAATKTGFTIVEYGIMRLQTSEFGVEKATLDALMEFRTRCIAGWPKASGGIVKPLQVWIDTNYAESRPAVVQFCRESDKVPQTRHVFRPLLGRAAGPEFGGQYRPPGKGATTVQFTGLNYHLVWFTRDHLHIVECNVDFWKSWVHDRLTTPADVEGAITLYAGIGNEHTKFTQHLTAERWHREFSKEKGGMVTWWERVRPNNHYFDATVYAAAACHYAQVIGQRARRQPEESIRNPMTMPDGRPFMVTQR